MIWNSRLKVPHLHPPFGGIFRTLTQTGRGPGYRKNKHELRKLLLEEVELFNHADQQYQEDAEEERMGRGGAIPPPSPR